jgi:2-octaprenyl-6-methoxyphenol hydroxylase
MNTPLQQYDFVISGSGLVGGVLACGLHDAGYRVAVIEPTERSVNPQPSHDDRTLVINAASLNILSNLGLLPSSLTRCPIRHIEITQARGLGHLTLHAADHGRDHFGAVVIARELGNTLLAAINHRTSSLDIQQFLDTHHSPQHLQDHQGFKNSGCPRDSLLHQYCPAELESFTQDDRRVAVRLTGGRTLTTAVLIGADGTHSRVRQLAGMSHQAHDYQQTAMIFTMTPERPTPDTAHERFTAQGPLAVLPLEEGRAGVVWIDRTEEIDAAMALSDDALASQLQQRLKSRLGAMRALGARATYPLVMRHTPHPVNDRVVVLGNAANAVHPVSAQGFNLGLRDAAMFIDIMSDLMNSQAEPDLDPASQLNHYAQQRAEDQAATVRYTDTLARAFAHPLAPTRWLSGLGLAAHAVAPALSRRLAHAAMGFRQPVSRLAKEQTP